MKDWLYDLSLWFNGHGLTYPMQAFILALLLLCLVSTLLTPRRVR